MLSNAEAARIRKLHSRKGRDRSGSFLVEGVRAVADLIESGLSVPLAVVAPSLGDSPGGAALLDLLRRSVPVREAAEHELAGLAATDSPQGVLAVAGIPAASLPRLAPEGRALALVLDRIQEPGNLGTLVRTADALGVRVVAALPGTVDAWNPKAVRAAAGSLFRLPVVSAGWPELLEWLRSNGFIVYGADSAGRPVEREVPAQRSALVVGNEGAGLDERVRAEVDSLLAVTIRGRAESLNVAAAAAILLHELTRAREEEL